MEVEDTAQNTVGLQRGGRGLGQVVGAAGGGHTGTRPGCWGCCGGCPCPPDLALAMIKCFHTWLLRRQESGCWAGLEEGQKMREKPPLSSPACLLLPEAPSSAAASAPGRSVWPMKAGDCSGPITCLSGGQKSQGLVGFQDISSPG